MSITAPAKTVTTESNYEIEFKASASDRDAGDVIDRFEWDFNDSSPVVAVDAKSDPTGRVAHKFAGTPGVAKTFRVSVKVYDNRNAVSSPATVSVTIPANAGPKASVISPDPKTGLKIGPGETYTFRASLDQASLLPGLKLGSFRWSFGDGSAPVDVAVSSNTSDGAIQHTFNAAGDFRVTVAATNDLGNTGPNSVAASVLVAAGNANQSPVITITNPSGNTTAYTSKPVPFAFSIQDGNGDAVQYTVDWGDGTKDVQVVSGTLTGKAVSLSHVYQDSQNPGTTNREIQVTATDGRSVNGEAAPQARRIEITYNQLPTATILTPQVSGTLPVSAENGGQGVPSLPPVTGDPEIVVIPMGGKLSFKGSGTPPSSGGTLTYQWTFNGGSPQAAAKADAGEITFAGETGKTLAYLVALTVKDEFSRASVNPVKERQKWVIVDGQNTQSFNLNFLYRQRKQSNQPDVISLVTESAGGLGAKIQILQDGIVNAHEVFSGTGATLSVPVRSNLPFYVQIPKFGTDTHTYLVRIPNQPGLDQALENIEAGAISSTTPGFGFKSTSAPWDPTLNIVTTEGFSPIGTKPAERTFVGTCPLAIVEKGVRWIDRLSAPHPDSPRGAYTQWIQRDNYVVGYNPIRGLRLFPEWLVGLSTVPTPDPLPSGTKPSGPDDLSFTMDLPKYTAGDPPTDPKPDANPPSASYAANEISAFRAPEGATSPYDVDRSGAVGTSTAMLQPREVDAQVRTFFQNMVFGPVGTGSLQGGLQQIPVSYVAADRERVPNVSLTYDFSSAYRIVFSYNEYLWSKAWARPLALNRSSVGWFDTGKGLTSYPYFRYSALNSGWPKLSEIKGLDGGLPSSFDFNVSSGSGFDPSKSPALDGHGTPDSTGIGRFYWTAFTPPYSAAVGSVISRTWRADGNTLQPPTTFPHADSSDPTPAFGFLPPLDPVVDYRQRDASGQLTGADKGGYRIYWYNPTRNANGAVVPPDFWVVLLEVGAFKQHFLLPADYPSSQSTDSLILTDARKYLPSRANSYQGGDTVGAGYCWFDVPVELRPAEGVEGTITVIAVRSVDKRSVISFARPLNRTDWIESIKTNTANVKVVTAPGVDISFAHRIAFSYPWDIVVANSGRFVIGKVQ